ncbi:MAG: hypothetical protein JO340_16200 [Acidobacteriaceae bacterium]|nr:hypothetical protein [Acidobacteriaceae bacterium]
MNYPAKPSGTPESPVGGVRLYDVRWPDGSLVDPRRKQITEDQGLKLVAAGVCEAVRSPHARVLRYFKMRKGRTEPPEKKTAPPVAVCNITVTREETHGRPFRHVPRGYSGVPVLPVLPVIPNNQ